MRRRQGLLTLVEWSSEAGLQKFLSLVVDDVFVFHEHRDCILDRVGSFSGGKLVSESTSGSKPLMGPGRIRRNGAAPRVPRPRVVCGGKF